MSWVSCASSGDPVIRPLDNDIQRGTAPPAVLVGLLTQVERKHTPEDVLLAGDLGPIATCAGKVVGAGARAASEDALKRVRAGTCIGESRHYRRERIGRGVDTAAHREAFDAGGRTIAVIGTPLDEAEL